MCVITLEQSENLNFIAEDLPLADLDTETRFKKILVTTSINESIAKDFKKFCALLGRKQNESIEIALQDFMKTYSKLLPVKPVFNLIEQKPIEQQEVKEKQLCCEMPGCRKKAVDKIEYLKDHRIVNVCIEHRRMIEQPHLWRLVK